MTTEPGSDDRQPSDDDDASVRVHDDGPGPLRAELPPDLPPDLPPEVPASEPRGKRKQGSFIKELPVLVLIAFGLALLIKSFFVQAFYIPSESMVPTLNIGDRVLVNKIVYKIRDPRRGEVVVFVGERIEESRSFWQKVRDTLTGGLGGAQPAERDYIKRVIGLPGETIEIADGVVTITPANGGASFTLKEPYLAEQRDLTPTPPTEVPKGSYFVLGDNRPNSSDSRTSLGPIERSEIVGRAFVRIWPLSRLKGLGRPDYGKAAAIGAAPALVLIPIAARRRARRAA